MPGGPARVKTDHDKAREAIMRTDDHPAVSGTAAAHDLAHRFTAALAARDAAALRSMFGDEVDFRGMTPRQVWTAPTPDALVSDVIFGAWFEPGDAITRIEWVQAGQVGRRTRIGYRLELANASGSFVLEQQAFLELTNGEITWLRLLCSGAVPVAGD
jgi:hypothetical protein